jgi:hypothetical protein
MSVVHNLRYFRFSSRLALPKPIADNFAACGGTDLRSAAAAPSPDGDGFVSSLLLPLSSERLLDPPSRETREVVERSNAGVLGFLLQEVDLEAMPRPADERLAGALAPLRIKLDMLIDMLARLSYRDVALPPVSDVELAPTRIVWHTRQYWQRGDWLRLALYFHPTFREPITLLVEVTGCFDQSRDGSCRVEGDLVQMPPSTAEGLSRLAFLSQRQQQTRQRPRTPVAVDQCSRS